MSNMSCAGGVAAHPRATGLRESDGKVGVASEGIGLGSTFYFTMNLEQYINED